MMHRREGIKVARARNWIAKFIDESGDDAPDDGKKYLPSVFTILDIFKIYKNEMEGMGFEEDGMVKKTSMSSGRSLFLMSK